MPYSPLFQLFDYVKIKSKPRSYSRGDSSQIKYNKVQVWADKVKKLQYAQLICTLFSKRRRSFFSQYPFSSFLSHLPFQLFFLCAFFHMLSVCGFFFLLLSVCDFCWMYVMKTFVIDQDIRKEEVEEEKDTVLFTEKSIRSVL